MSTPAPTRKRGRAGVLATKSPSDEFKSPVTQALSKRRSLRSNTKLTEDGQAIPIEKKPVPPPEPKTKRKSVGAKPAEKQAEESSVAEQAHENGKMDVEPAEKPKASENETPNANSDTNPDAIKAGDQTNTAEKPADGETRSPAAPESSPGDVAAASSNTEQESPCLLYLLTKAKYP
eukprot:EC125104.1.p1 GENE.EC125104.1~~EC125104.1.p1  ORF type:complete len:177 (+),score=15.32 EC125104.1:195-725(+)